MRFMIMVRANAESEAETTPVPSEELLAAMVAYHEELAKAGVLLDASGLQPSRKGWRIRYQGGRRTVRPSMPAPSLRKPASRIGSPAG